MLDKALREFATNKTQMSYWKTFFFGIMAGISIGFGALLFVITINYSTNIEFRLLGSVLFSIGLILILLLNAQLFTGNNLFLFSLFSKSISRKHLIFNWLIVIFANFVGALLFSMLVTSLISHFYWDSQIIQTMYTIAKTKMAYSIPTLLYKSILCNILVCIAITSYLLMQKIILKFIGVVIPITLFVFMGFEHSIANMFFLMSDLLFNIQGSGAIHLNYLKDILIGNLLVVTFGNIIGGGILCSLFYFFVTFTQKQN